MSRFEFKPYTKFWLTIWSRAALPNLVATNHKWLFKFILDKVK